MVTGRWKLTRRVQALGGSPDRGSCASSVQVSEDLGVHTSQLRDPPPTAGTKSRFHLVSITWMHLPARRIRMSGVVWKSRRWLVSAVRQNRRQPCNDTVRSVLALPPLLRPCRELCHIAVRVRPRACRDRRRGRHRARVHSARPAPRGQHAALQLRAGSAIRCRPSSTALSFDHEPGQ